MDKEKIKDILLYGEKLTVEIKKSINEIPKSVWETYSSFANTNGGIILLGVEENMQSDGERYVVKGVKNPDKRIKEFWDTINSSKVSSNILMDHHVGQCKMDEGVVVWIKVPQANYSSKPVYINENPFKGSFKRNYEGDYHCSEEEVRAMIRDAEDKGEDGRLLEGFTMEDIDMNSLRGYRNQFQNLHPHHVWNELDDKEFLRNMGGYTVDRRTKSEGLTVAGLLMFGTSLAIRDEFPFLRMDYLDFSNINDDVRWNDRVTYDGMWENNLYTFVKKILPEIIDNIKTPFMLDGIVRVDDTNVSKAIRESVVNSLIHADYRCKGIIKVEKYKDCIIVSNPGNLKLPVQDIYEGRYTGARNPYIQQFFRMIGLGDNIVSGFPSILKTWKEKQWRRPDLYDNQELNQVELRLWMVPHLSKERIIDLYKIFGESYQLLSKNEQLILATAHIENMITNKRLQTVLEEEEVIIGKLLQKLIDKNMLIKQSLGKSHKYILNENYELKENDKTVVNSKSDISNLNNNEVKIISYVSKNGKITSSDVMDLIDTIATNQGAYKALNRLTEKELLTKVKDGRTVYYVLK